MKTFGDLKLWFFDKGEDLADFFWLGKPTSVVLETHSSESAEFALYFRNNIVADYPELPVVIRKTDTVGETECGVRVVIDRGRAWLRPWNRVNNSTRTWVDPYRLIDRFVSA